MPATQRLKVNAHKRRVGRPASEMLEVEPQGDGTYVLARSPVLVQGLAENDVFSLDDDGWAVVHRHAGNVAVQMFHRLDYAPLEQVRAKVADLGGHGYDRDRETAVYTIPVRRGFRRIEAIFARIERIYGTRMTWRFGNVYADDGETPLEWWAGMEMDEDRLTREQERPAFGD